MAWMLQDILIFPFPLPFYNLFHDDRKFSHKRTKQCYTLGIWQEVHMIEENHIALEKLIIAGFASSLPFLVGELVLMQYIETGEDYSLSCILEFSDAFVS